jgi:hypothetical protein
VPGAAPSVPLGKNRQAMPELVASPKVKQLICFFLAASLGFPDAVPIRLLKRIAKEFAWQRGMHIGARVFECCGEMPGGVLSRATVVGEIFKSA